MSAFTPDRTCVDCGVERPVMIGMRPGVDGREWFLYRTCHRRSTTPEQMATLDSVKALRPKARRPERQGQH